MNKLGEGILIRKRNESRRTEKVRSKLSKQWRKFIKLKSKLREKERKDWKRSKRKNKKLKKLKKSFKNNSKMKLSNRKRKEDWNSKLKMMSTSKLTQLVWKYPIVKLISRYKCQLTKS